MSQENVESLRRGVDAQNREDKATWLLDLDPDAVMIPARDWPGSSPVRGAEAIWDSYEEATAVWKDGSFELGEIIDAEGGQLVANVRREVRGKESGAEINFNYWIAVAYQKGKARRIEWFAERAEALEAAGMSE